LPEPLPELFVDIGLDDPDWPPEPVGRWAGRLGGAASDQQQPTGHYCRHRPYSHDWPFLYLKRRTISDGGGSHSSAQTPIQRVEQGTEARGDAGREAESADPFQLDEACRALRTVRTACTAAAPVNP